MVDLSETPAVPPEETGGDERAGFQIAGALLLLLGFGLGDVVNIYLHLAAPSTGLALGPWVLFPTLGPYAWFVLGLGALTGLFGIVLIALSRSATHGPIVLPGKAY